MCLIKKMREAEGGGAGSYSTSVIEQLTEEITGIHGGGNDTHV